MKKILYISYDGMTDPLGQSQVIPYLLGLSKAGYSFTILSFEKKERYRKYRDLINSLLEPAGIQWVPLSFTTRPPLLSKFYDVLRMRSTALSLHRRTGFDMVHCRSYPAADIGLLLKKRKGVKFLFDMRGFWADEKKDGGAWPQDHFLFRRVYRYYKKKEKAYLRHADHIISLTEAGKQELMTWPAYINSVPVTVIPCCADMTHFSLVQPGEKQAGRKLLGLPEESLVLSYLGSVGSWYMLDEMLAFFSAVKEKYPGARFLFITHSAPPLILDKLPQFGLEATDIVITEASRAEVPVYSKAADLSVSFIRPVYSKLSSSPTKLGELMSMGIPVIANSGVGDVAAILESTGAGIVLREFTPQAYAHAVAALPELLGRSPAAIREKSKAIYDLDNGVQKYLAIYQQILK